MKGWLSTTLSNVCNEVTYGYTESASQEKIGPKFLRITDIASNRLDWQDVPYCSISEKDFEKYKLLPGDIVIARTGATTGANYTLKETDPTDVVFASYLIRYKINPKIANPYFIGHLLRSTSWIEYVDAIAGGSAQPGANAKQLGSFELHLPSLKEQIAIASVLSSLDDKIDLLHRQNKTLEQMAETLFRQWFVEEAKEEWEEGKISDLIYFNPIRKISKGSMNPYLEMSELSTSTYAPANWYLRTFSSGSKFINEDTLLARITPCLENGKAAFVDFLKDTQIGWGSTEFIVMRPKENIHPFFAYTLVRNKEFKEFAESCMQGSSGRQRVDIDNLQSYKISIPSNDVIEKFNSFCITLVPKLKYNSCQIKTLTQLRDTLLPKLMNGEVRVKM